MSDAVNDDRWFLDAEIGERFPAWTRGNAADVFPEPFSPLGQTLVIRQGMCTGLRDAYIRLGAMTWNEFEDPVRPDLFKVFGGYPYNPLSMTRVLGARMPGGSPEMIDKAFFDDDADIPPYEHQPWHDSPDAEARLGATMGWVLTVESLPDLDADKEMAKVLRDTRPDLSTATDAALVARARSVIPMVQQSFDNGMYVSSMASVGPGVLGGICEALGDATMAVRLLAGIEVDSGLPPHAMWELGRLAHHDADLSAAFDLGPDHVLEALRASDKQAARDFLSRFDHFLDEYGSRGPSEYDPISSSWEAKPRIALAAIDLMRKSDDAQAPTVRGQASVAERDAIATRIRQQLQGDAETAGMFEAALRSAALFLAGRERAKTTTVRVINEVRMAVRELGRRYVERGLITEVEQIFMLTDDELDHVRHDPEHFRQTIAERWAQYRRLADHEPVFNVNHVAPHLSDMTRRADKGVSKAVSGTVLKGTAGSGGVATGRARVVNDAADPVGLEPGDVLVAPQTDPSWVPLFVPAAAVVVNVGALGSHAMIVSRELGIPCVVAVSDATYLIPDGATVTVDGTAGTVTVH